MGKVYLRLEFLVLGLLLMCVTFLILMFLRLLFMVFWLMLLGLRLKSDIELFGLRFIGYVCLFLCNLRGGTLTYRCIAGSCFRIRLLAFREICAFCGLLQRRHELRGNVVMFALFIIHGMLLCFMSIGTRSTPKVLLPIPQIKCVFVRKQPAFLCWRSQSTFFIVLKGKRL